MPRRYARTSQMSWCTPSASKSVFAKVHVLMHKANNEGHAVPRPTLGAYANSWSLVPRHQAYLQRHKFCNEDHAFPRPTLAAYAEPSESESVLARVHLLMHKYHNEGYVFPGHPLLLIQNRLQLCPGKMCTCRCTSFIM